MREIGSTAITLQDYITTLGYEKVAARINVTYGTVYAWSKFVSVPNYRQAVKLIDTSGGVLNWHNIYEPYRAAKAKK